MNGDPIEGGEAPPRVLIIEDYPSASMSLAIHFRRVGWDPICLNNGFQAVDYVNSGAVPPEAVLVDLSLPGPSGVEVIKLIRSCKVCSRKTGEPVRIVVYTALDENNGEIVDAVRYGADAVLLKPAGFDKTLSVLRGDSPGDIDLDNGGRIRGTTSSQPEICP